MIPADVHELLSRALPRITHPEIVDLVATYTVTGTYRTAWIPIPEGTIPTIDEWAWEVAYRAGEFTEDRIDGEYHRNALADAMRQLNAKLLQCNTP